MATSSIFADFSITEPEKAARFVEALERSRRAVQALDKKKKPALRVVELRGKKEILAFLRGTNAPK